MARIDTTMIDGYDTMTAEEKLAALESFEYDDHAAALEKAKNDVSRANSQAAEWKRKHNALLSEDERKRQERDDALESMKSELETLRKDKTVSEYKAKYLSMGYGDELASSTAQAMADGDIAAVFANQQAFLDGYSKQVKAELIKNTPRPGAGGTGTEGLDYDKKIETAMASGDYAAVAYYTRLKAQNAQTK